MSRECCRDPVGVHETDGRLSVDRIMDGSGRGPEEGPGCGGQVVYRAARMVWRNVSRQEQE